jgi:putative CocE/NonD family hydrolase
MNLINRFVEWKFHLPPAKIIQIDIQHNIPIKMPDGAILYAERFYPSQGDKHPTVLVRSPYGRKGLILEMIARPIAARGFNVLIQSCRGTFGSEGNFYPFHHEAADGLATISWLKQQPWYSGAFAMFGPSYLSYVQWAVAAEAGPELKALIPIVTTSEFRSVTYPGETFALDTVLSWAQGMEYQEESTFRALFSRSQHNRKLKKGYDNLPLNQSDTIAAGDEVAFFQDWLKHNTPGDPFWNQSDHSTSVSKVTAPAHLISGWYDVLLPHTVACYLRLRKAGCNPYLTLGPWTHGAPGLQPVIMRETIHWLNAYLLNDRIGLRKSPVRVFVMGANQWKEFDEWPPTDYAPQPWYLEPKGGLSPSIWYGSEPDHFQYDPADPTPSVGGSSLTPNAGAKNNRKLESRRDVLVYSSAQLKEDLEVIGPVQVELFIKSSLEHTDFFARLCDVNHQGKSTNISDGIQRLTPDSHPKDADGIQKITVELWPTAHCFKKGHRIRLQISSGAHPRFARNPGSGEPLATATKLIPADQLVFHDGNHASAVILPAKHGL